MTKVFSYTKALCPLCKEIVDACLVERDDMIYLQKFCKVHGSTYALTCSDAQWYRESVHYVKPGQYPQDISVKEYHGCPDSCGLCPEHQQHTCLPIIEITSMCDMNCPICLKSFQQSFQINKDEFKYILKRLQECEENLHIINLSGGEPTLHPDFEDFLRIAVEHDIMQVTVSTNGLRLLDDEKLRQLLRETGAIVALQFDGFAPETYQTLRGKDFSESKRELINILEKENIRYSLVTTLVKGVNDHEILSIVDFFFRSKALSLMFQLAAFTGKAASLTFDHERITIPDVVKAIEKSQYSNDGDFNPLPCSHFSCFALSYYLNLDDGRYLNLKDFLGKEDYLDVIANRTLPGLDQEGYAIFKEKIYEFWSASDSSNTSEAVLQRIRKILEELNTSGFSPKKMFDLGTESMKAIFIHQFMDAHTLDFGRLIKCCNHYVQADGRIIPMCAQNVFFQ